ncbi:hypothetical protein [Arcanobacterium canis]
MSTDILTWYRQFQEELREDLATHDGTAKPGHYTIARYVMTPVPEDDWNEIVVFCSDSSEHMPLIDFVKSVLLDPGHELFEPLAKELVYGYGFDLDCGMCAGYCECEMPTVGEIRESAGVRASIVDDLGINNERVIMNIINDSLEHRAVWARPEHVENPDFFFLTRKSAQRHLDNFPHFHDGEKVRTYAHYVHHNPDLENAIRFLAAIDLDQSNIILKGDNQ